MKQLITLLLCTFVASTALAGDGLRYLANVSGTAFEQISVDSTQRIKSSPVNTARVFEEFGVSPNDYALVLDINSGNMVTLVPKSAGSGLPIIPVMQRESVRTISNSKADAHMFESPIGNSASSAGIFTGLRGTMLGSLKFSDDDRLLKFSASFNGSGSDFGGPVVTDQAKGAFSTGVLLKLKVSKGALFTQAP